MEKHVLHEWEKLFTPKIKFNAGVDFDIERVIYNIFYEFDGSQEPRFSIFSKIWRETKLGLIFCGRESFRDLSELTADIFFVTKLYAKAIFKKKENNILIRYAAVYMLYAFYFKQPCRPRVRIKLSHAEFLELTNLMEEAKRDLHFDILYAWSKLIINHAFQYSVISTGVGLEVCRAQERRDSEVFGRSHPTESCFQSKEFRSMVRRLGKAHENYVQIKSSLNKGADQSLSSIDVGLMEKIADLTTYKNKPIIETENLEDIGDTRKQIKNKYFSSAHEKEQSEEEQDAEWTPVIRTSKRRRDRKKGGNKKKL